MKSILLVDDEEIILQTLSRFLEKQGYDVAVAKSGEEAYQKLQISRFNLVLSDLAMDGMSGIDLLKKLGEIDSLTMFMLLTGHGDMDSAIEAFRSGAFDFISKPCNNDELLLRIKRCLESQELKSRLKERTKTLEVIFDNAVCCLVLLDREYNFVRVNKIYADACGKKVSDFEGKNHFDLYPSSAKEIFDEVVRTRKPYQAFSRPFEFPDHPERGVTYWDWTLVPLFDDAGEIEFLAFSLNDVTRRKRAEQALEKRPK